MSHHPRQPDGYEARLQEYMERELHPDTAKNIGDIVARSTLASSEVVMSVVMQMQLDHIRRDDDLAASAGPNVVPIRPLNWDGVAPGPGPDRHPVL